MKHVQAVTLPVNPVSGKSAKRSDKSSPTMAFLAGETIGDDAILPVGSATDAPARRRRPPLSSQAQGADQPLVADDLPAASGSTALSAAMMRTLLGFQEVD